MNIFEIVSAIALIIACVFIIIVVLMKDTNSNMSQAISGGSADNFYQKNAGRTKDAKLNRTAVVATFVFFVLALAVNIINVHSTPTEDTEEDASGIVSEDTTSEAASADGDDSITVEVADDSGAEENTADEGGAEESTPDESGAEESTADESSAEESTADESTAE